MERRVSPIYNAIGEVPEWGRAAVRDAMGRGILGGVSDGMLGLSWNDVRSVVLAYRREHGAGPPSENEDRQAETA